MISTALFKFNYRCAGQFCSVEVREYNGGLQFPSYPVKGLLITLTLTLTSGESTKGILRMYGRPLSRHIANRIFI